MGESIDNKNRLIRLFNGSIQDVVVAVYWLLTRDDELGGFFGDPPTHHPGSSVSNTPDGRRKYSKRMSIVEPVFGSNIRTCKRMDRFTLRGKTKVNIQWMLYCLVHNIEKIINYGISYNLDPT